MSQELVIPEFGIKRDNEERRDGGCGMVFDPETQLYAVGRQIHDGLFRIFSGGVDEGEDIETGTLREVIEESGLNDFSYIEKIAESFAHYHNSLRNVNRVTKSTCFLVILKSRRLIEVKLEEHEKFYLDWATAADLRSNWESKNENHDLDHWLYYLEKTAERLRELGYDKINF
ncbi:MAG: NUDIX domain-containing protein [Patescibacteria group bacterium]|jgi:ADP-ribose pyrophosphatase YjhB (NUDIX family)